MIIGKQAHDHLGICLVCVQEAKATHKRLHSCGCDITESAPELIALRLVRAHPSQPSSRGPHII